MDFDKTAVVTEVMEKAKFQVTEVRFQLCSFDFLSRIFVAMLDYLEVYKHTDFQQIILS